VAVGVPVADGDAMGVRVGDADGSTVAEAGVVGPVPVGVGVSTAPRRPVSSSGR
jgi:hypothetical protein